MGFEKTTVNILHSTIVAKKRDRVKLPQFNEAPCSKLQGLLQNSPIIPTNHPGVPLEAQPPKVPRMWIPSAAKTVRVSAKGDKVYKTHGRQSCNYLL